MGYNWKLPYCDPQLKDNLLSGKKHRSFEELEALLGSDEASRAEKLSESADAVGGAEVSGTSQSSQQSSTASTPVERGLDEVEAAETTDSATTPVQKTDSAPENEKNKRKRSLKRGRGKMPGKNKKGTGRKKKGLSKEQKQSAKEFKRKARAEGRKVKPYGKGPFRTADRSSTVLPEFIGSTVMVHNGKDFDRVSITESMVGHKLGEFSVTRRDRNTLDRKKSKITIRKKDSVGAVGTGYVSLSRIRDWSWSSE